LAFFVGDRRHRERVTPGVLGGVQGLVGGVEQLDRGKPVAREDRDRSSPAYATKLAEALACLGVTPESGGE